MDELDRQIRAEARRFVQVQGVIAIWLLIPPVRIAITPSD